MAYTDYSNQWVIDQFLTFLQANQLGANDKHLYDTLAVEHNINTATIDGTHKALNGSYLTTILVNTSYVIPNSTTWTPVAGLYQMSIDPGGSAYSLQFYIAGAWRVIDTDYGLFLFDGTNMKIVNTGAFTSVVYYQKF